MYRKKRPSVWTELLVASVVYALVIAPWLPLMPARRAVANNATGSADQADVLVTTREGVSAQVSLTGPGETLLRGHATSTVGAELRDAVRFADQADGGDATADYAPGDTVVLDGGIAPTPGDYDYAWHQVGAGPAVVLEPGQESGTVRFVAPEVEATTTIEVRLTVSHAERPTHVATTLIRIVPPSGTPTAARVRDTSALDRSRQALAEAVLDKRPVVRTMREQLPSVLQALVLATNARDASDASDERWQQAGALSAALTTQLDVLLGQLIAGTEGTAESRVFRIGVAHTDWLTAHASIDDALAAAHTGDVIYAGRNHVVPEEVSTRLPAGVWLMHQGAAQAWVGDDAGARVLAGITAAPPAGAAGPLRPIAHAGPEGREIAPGAPIALSAGASVLLGAQAPTIRWRQTHGVVCPFVNNISTGIEVTCQPPLVGRNEVLQFALEITTADGAVSRDDVEITVLGTTAAGTDTVTIADTFTDDEDGWVPWGDAEGQLDWDDRSLKVSGTHNTKKQGAQRELVFDDWDRRGRLVLGVSYRANMTLTRDPNDPAASRCSTDKTIDQLRRNLSAHAGIRVHHPATDHKLVPVSEPRGEADQPWDDVYGRTEIDITDAVIDNDLSSVRVILYGKNYLVNACRFRQEVWFDNVTLAVRTWMPSPDVRIASRSAAGDPYAGLGGTVTWSADGVGTYTPPPTFSGNDYVCGQVRDADGVEHNRCATVFVESVHNDPPVAELAPRRTVAHRAGAGHQLVEVGLSSIRDPEQQQLSCTWYQESGPPVTLQGAGEPSMSFRAPPVTDPSGEDTYEFAVEVSDGDNVEVLRTAITMTAYADTYDVVVAPNDEAACSAGDVSAGRPCDAYDSLATALPIAAALAADARHRQQIIVLLRAHVYEDISHVTVPRGITIRGEEQNATVIRLPSEADGFLLHHDDARVENLTIEGGQRGVVIGPGPRYLFVRWDGRRSYRYPVTRGVRVSHVSIRDSVTGIDIEGRVPLQAWARKGSRKMYVGVRKRRHAGPVLLASNRIEGTRRCIQSVGAARLTLRNNRCMASREGIVIDQLSDRSIITDNELVATDVPLAVTSFSQLGGETTARDTGAAAYPNNTYADSVATLAARPRLHIDPVIAQENTPAAVAIEAEMPANASVDATIGLEFAVVRLPCQGQLIADGRAVTSFPTRLSAAELATLTYEPDAGYLGTDGFTLAAMTSAGQMVTRNVAVHVQGSEPVVELAPSADVGEPIEMSLRAGDVDLNDVLHPEVVVPPKHGVLSIRSAGTSAGDWVLSYQPGVLFGGHDTATVRVTDGTTAAEREIEITRGSGESVDGAGDATESWDRPGAGECRQVRGQFNAEGVAVWGGFYRLAVQRPQPAETGTGWQWGQTTYETDCDVRVSADPAVPSHYATLADALAAATPDNTICVAPGTYAIGTQTLSAAGMTLRGAGPNLTTLDGSLQIRGRDITVAGGTITGDIDLSGTQVWTEYERNRRRIPASRVGQRACGTSHYLVTTHRVSVSQGARLVDLEIGGRLIPADAARPSSSPRCHRGDVQDHWHASGPPDTVGTTIADVSVGGTVLGDDVTDSEASPTLLSSLAVEQSVRTHVELSSDFENERRQFRIAEPPAHGTLLVDWYAVVFPEDRHIAVYGGGTWLEYESDFEYAGPDQFVYEVKDPDSDAWVPHEVTISVAAVDHAPIPAPITRWIDTSHVLVFDLESHLADADPEGEPVTVTLLPRRSEQNPERPDVDTPDNIRFAGGRLLYTPPVLGSNDTLADRIVYEVSDPAGNVGVGEIMIHQASADPTLWANDVVVDTELGTAVAIPLSVGVDETALSQRRTQWTQLDAGHQCDIVVDDDGPAMFSDVATAALAAPALQAAPGRLGGPPGTATVCVKAGTYEGDVDLPMCVSLIGENPATTTLRGTVRVPGNCHADVSGFTFEQGGVALAPYRYRYTTRRGNGKGRTITTRHNVAADHVCVVGNRFRAPAASTVTEPVVVSDLRESQARHWTGTRQCIAQYETVAEALADGDRLRAETNRPATQPLRLQIHGEHDIGELTVPGCVSLLGVDVATSTLRGTLTVPEICQSEVSRLTIADGGIVTQPYTWHYEETVSYRTHWALPKRTRVEARQRTQCPVCIERNRFVDGAVLTEAEPMSVTDGDAHPYASLLAARTERACADQPSRQPIDAIVVGVPVPDTEEAALTSALADIEAAEADTQRVVQITTLPPDGSLCTDAGCLLESGALLSLTEASTLQFVPDADVRPTTGFLYRLIDHRGDSATTITSDEATVTIRVAGGNHRPELIGRTLFVKGQTPADVWLPETDGDGETVTYQVARAAAHGTVTIDASGARYVAHADYRGTDSFALVGSDGTSDGAAATFTVVVGRAVPESRPVATTGLPLKKLLGAEISELAPLGDAATRPSYTVERVPLAGDVCLSGPEDHAVSFDLVGINPSLRATSDGYSAYGVHFDSGALRVDIDEQITAYRDLSYFIFDAPVPVCSPGRDVGCYRQANELIVYYPYPDETGDVTFLYRVFDGDSVSPPARATVAVTPTNDAPTLWVEGDREYRRRPSLPVVGATKRDCDADTIDVAGLWTTRVEQRSLADGRVSETRLRPISIRSHAKEPEFVEVTSYLREVGGAIDAGTLTKLVCMYERGKRDYPDLHSFRLAVGMFQDAAVTEWCHPVLTRDRAGTVTYRREIADYVVTLQGHDEVMANGATRMVAGLSHRIERAGAIAGGDVLAEATYRPDGRINLQRWLDEHGDRIEDIRGVQTEGGTLLAGATNRVVYGYDSDTGVRLLEELEKASRHVAMSDAGDVLSEVVYTAEDLQDRPAEPAQVVRAIGAESGHEGTLLETTVDGQVMSYERLMSPTTGHVVRRTPQDAGPESVITTFASGDDRFVALGAMRSEQSMTSSPYLPPERVTYFAADGHDVRVTIGYTVDAAGHTLAVERGDTVRFAITVGEVACDYAVTIAAANEVDAADRQPVSSTFSDVGDVVGDVVRQAIVPVYGVPTKLTQACPFRYNHHGQQVPSSTALADGVDTIEWQWGVSPYRLGEHSVPQGFYQHQRLLNAETGEATLLVGETCVNAQRRIMQCVLVNGDGHTEDYQDNPHGFDRRRCRTYEFDRGLGLVVPIVRTTQVSLAEIRQGRTQCAPEESSSGGGGGGGGGPAEWSGWSAATEGSILGAFADYAPLQDGCVRSVWRNTFGNEIEQLRLYDKCRGFSRVWQKTRRIMSNTMTSTDWVTMWQYDDELTPGDDGPLVAGATMTQACYTSPNLSGKSPTAAWYSGRTHTCFDLQDARELVVSYYKANFQGDTVTDSDRDDDRFVYARLTGGTPAGVQAQIERFIGDDPQKLLDALRSGVELDIAGQDDEPPADAAPPNPRTPRDQQDAWRDRGLVEGTPQVRFPQWTQTIDDELVNIEIIEWTERVGNTQRIVALTIRGVPEGRCDTLRTILKGRSEYVWIEDFDTDVICETVAERRDRQSAAHAWTEARDAILTKINTELSWVDTQLARLPDPVSLSQADQDTIASLRALGARTIAPRYQHLVLGDDLAPAKHSATQAQVTAIATWQTQHTGYINAYVTSAQSLYERLRVSLNLEHLDDIDPEPDLGCDLGFGVWDSTVTCPDTTRPDGSLPDTETIAAVYVEDGKAHPMTVADVTAEGIQGVKDELRARGNTWSEDFAPGERAASTLRIAHYLNDVPDPVMAALQRDGVTVHAVMDLRVNGKSLQGVFSCMQGRCIILIDVSLPWYMQRAAVIHETLHAFDSLGRHSPGWRFSTSDAFRRLHPDYWQQRLFDWLDSRPNVNQQELFAAYGSAYILNKLDNIDHTPHLAAPGNPHYHVDPELYDTYEAYFDALPTEYPDLFPAGAWTWSTQDYPTVPGDLRPSSPTWTTDDLKRIIRGSAAWDELSASESASVQQEIQQTQRYLPDQIVAMLTEAGVTFEGVRNLVDEDGQPISSYRNCQSKACLTLMDVTDPARLAELTIFEAVLVFDTADLLFAAKPGKFSKSPEFREFIANNDAARALMGPIPSSAKAEDAYYSGAFAAFATAYFLSKKLPGHPQDSKNVAEAYFDAFPARHPELFPDGEWTWSESLDANRSGADIVPALGCDVGFGFFDVTAECPTPGNAHLVDAVYMTGGQITPVVLADVDAPGLSAGLTAVKQALRDEGVDWDEGVPNIYYSTATLEIAHGLNYVPDQVMTVLQERQGLFLRPVLGLSSNGNPVPSASSCAYDVCLVLIEVASSPTSSALRVIEQAFSLFDATDTGDYSQGRLSDLPEFQDAVASSLPYLDFAGAASLSVNHSEAFAFFATAYVASKKLPDHRFASYNYAAAYFDALPTQFPELFPHGDWTWNNTQNYAPLPSLEPPPPPTAIDPVKEDLRQQGYTWDELSTPQPSLAVARNYAFRVRYFRRLPRFHVVQNLEDNGTPIGAVTSCVDGACAILVAASDDSNLLTFRALQGAMTFFDLRDNNTWGRFSALPTFRERIQDNRPEATSLTDADYAAVFADHAAFHIYDTFHPGAITLTPQVTLNDTDAFFDEIGWTLFNAPTLSLADYLKEALDERGVTWRELTPPQFSFENNLIGDARSYLPEQVNTTLDNTRTTFHVVNHLESRGESVGHVAYCFRTAGECVVLVDATNLTPTDEVFHVIQGALWVYNVRNTEGGLFSDAPTFRDQVGDGVSATADPTVYMEAFAEHGALYLIRKFNPGVNRGIDPTVPMTNPDVYFEGLGWTWSTTPTFSFGERWGVPPPPPPVGGFWGS